MKKLFAAIIVISLCMSLLAACANDNDNYDRIFIYPEYISEETNSSETSSESPRNTDSEQNDSETESSIELSSTETNTEQTHDTEIYTETYETETALEHVDKDDNSYCDICGEILKSESVEDEVYTMKGEKALFEKFYDNSFDLTAKEHSDGSKMTEDSNTFYSDDGSILKFENYTNLYKNARDAKGNPVLKLGKSDALGSFEITIPQNVNIVILEIAKYKDQDSTVIINGREYTITKESDNGEYEEIIIDTATFKKITVSTIKEHTMCMIRSIEFIK